MATDIEDLIERLTVQHSLLNVSLSYNADPVAPEFQWSCSAQWLNDGEGNYDGRGVDSGYGPDPIAAILNCARTIAIKQDGPLPVRFAL